MGADLWFILSLVLAFLYALRICTLWPASENSSSDVPLMGSWNAVFLSVLMIGFGYLLYRCNVEKNIITTITSLVILVVILFFSFRYWFRNKLWSYFSRVIAVAVVILYLKNPGMSNIVLLICSLAFTLLGLCVSRSWIYIVYSMLMVWDVYAVWYSHIMTEIVRKNPGILPGGFVTFIARAGFIGMGDIIFSVIGLAAILNFCGKKWSVISILLYALSLFAINVIAGMGLDLFNFVPLLVVISPITIFCLFFGSRSQELHQ